MKFSFFKKPIFSVFIFAFFGLHQAITASREVAKKNKNPLTCAAIECSINKGFKNAYWLFKQSAAPILGLYLFIKYLSPMSKKFCWSEKEENTTPALLTSSEKGIGTSPSLEELKLLLLKIQEKVDKPIFASVKSAEKWLDVVLGVFIIDVYVKPPLKSLQETLQSWIEKIEVKLNLV